MGTSPTPPPDQGGLARYVVEHREVGWMALVAVLLWGWTSYTRLAQQEDPSIPERRAVLVTRFPGASASKIEQLVTRKLEEKLNELEAIEELKSQSRFGVSVLYVTQYPASGARIDQGWDKIRSKLNAVHLPEGCGPPFLDTDFGNTVALLFGLTSPRISDAECQARANLIRSRLAQVRAGRAASGRITVFAFFPPDVAASYRATLQQAFLNGLEYRGLGEDILLDQGEAFILVDFRTRCEPSDPARGRATIEQYLAEFGRQHAGSEGELHPDFTGAVVLAETDNLLNQIRRTAPYRYSYRELEQAAEALEDELKQVGSVGRVRLLGNVPEMIYLYFSIPYLEGFRLSPDQVLASIATRNAIIPGGVLRTEGQNFPVQLTGEFTNRLDLADLLDTVVATVGGTRGAAEAADRGFVPEARAPGIPVYLRDVFEVRRGYENPISFSVEAFRRTSADGPLTQSRAVLLAVEMKEGQIIGGFDAEVRAVVDRFQQGRLDEGMSILRLSDQPGAVTGRIAQFTRCFLEAVLIVVLVALFLMDWRSALVVAAAIPLTIALTLGGMKLCGVPLHQISIASLIIALGMLVDDPVVASDGINRELAQGHPRGVAAWLGPFRLRRAIFFGTIINIVAFAPLAWLPGDKGAFITALPTVVALSLVASRLVSMTFIPLLGYYLLRGQKGLESGGEIRSFVLFRPVDRVLVAVLPRYQRLLRLALARPGRTAGFAYGLLLLSFGLTPFFGHQFFPPAERRQCLIDIELPESASIGQTREVCRQVVGTLGRHPEIASGALFLGGTAPRFYYNVSPREPGNYLAQVLVNTRRAEDVPPLLVALRSELDAQIAGARCVVKQLEQGPPVESPIQVRLSGPDLETLRSIADRVTALLAGVGAYKVHDDLGRRVPTLEIAIDQERANTLEIGNAQVGRITQAAFAGLRVSELRDGDHLIPIVVRLRAEERNEAEKLRGLYARSQRGQFIPLENFAEIGLRLEYATIAHFNKLRAVTVEAHAEFGELPSRVLARARPGLDRLRSALPPGYRLEYGGEEKELHQSRREMGEVMLISLSLIAVAMVIQFQSVTKSLVVLLTVPLGLIGAFLGVGITRAPMGFMALLGIVSLAGIIVSHIIVLSDFIEEARADGTPLEEALVQAGLVRLRAVLVTVLATVGGLIPLALTGGALWKPLTAVHIFGLLLATLLTLVLLPVLYYLFCARFRWIR